MQGTQIKFNLKILFTAILITSLYIITPAPELNIHTVRELCNYAHNFYGEIIYDKCIEYEFTSYEACEIMTAINSEAKFNRIAIRRRVKIITENSNTYTNYNGYDVGICQVYTGTALWICKVYKRWDLYERARHIDNLCDAELNIELCVMLFRWGCDNYNMTPKQFYHTYYQTGRTNKFGDIERFNKFWNRNFKGKI